MTDHRRTLILAAGAIDFDLVPDDQAALNAHLASCSDCRRTAGQLRSQASALHSRARAIPPAALRQRVFDEWLRPPARRRSIQSAQLILLALVAMIAILGLAVAGAGFRRLGEIVAPTASTAPTVAPTLAATPEPTPSIVLGRVDVLAVPAGAQAHEHLCQVVAESDCAVAVLAAAGSIWTTTSGGVARVDPSTGEVVASIPVGAFPHRLAVVDGGIWATVETPGRVVRVDPATNEVVASIDVGGIPVGLAGGAGSLWVVDTAGHRVVRVNTVAGTVEGTVDVGKAPWGIVELDGSIWVSERHAATLWRIDPIRNRLVETIDIKGSDTPDSNAHGDLTVADGRIWVTGHDKVKAYDPATGQLREQFVPTYPEIAIDANSIWVVSSWTRTLTRLDRSTLEVLGQQTLPLIDGGTWETPIAIGDDGRLWTRTYDGDLMLEIEPTS
jgi:sugar lactone lactonase YvrE